MEQPHQKATKVNRQPTQVAIVDVVDTEKPQNKTNLLTTKQTKNVISM